MSDDDKIENYIRDFELILIHKRKVHQLKRTVNISGSSVHDKYAYSFDNKPPENWDSLISFYQLKKEVGEHYHIFVSFRNYLNKCNPIFWSPLTEANLEYSICYFQHHAQPK